MKQIDSPWSTRRPTTNHGNDIHGDSLSATRKSITCTHPPPSRARAETVTQELEESDSLAPANVCGGGLELGSEVPRGGTKGAKHGAATRIVTVAGLACPCGGTHVSSTGQLEGVRVTKVKAKKGALRVSYTLLA